MENEIINWLGVAGLACTGLGSILLAWRVATLLRWTANCLSAHDQAITQLLRLVSGHPQTEEIPINSVSHLVNIEAKLGLGMLVSGFALLGIGSLCKIAAHLL